MLTAHQRLTIRTRLPEVYNTFVVDDHDPIRMAIIRLKLTDGSEIAIYGSAFEKASRCRLRVDYSGRVDLLPIPPEMRTRLEAVFGPLRYRGDPC